MTQNGHEKRIGFVGIIVENRRENAPKVNAILTEFGESIVARTGIPYSQRHCAVITLVVDATTDGVGRMTGRLGQIPGVTVKSAMAKAANGEGEAR